MFIEINALHPVDTNIVANRGKTFILALNIVSFYFRIIVLGVYTPFNVRVRLF